MGAMHFWIDHRDHRTGNKQLGTDVVECADLEQAERDTFQSLGCEVAEAQRLHTDASIIIRDDSGKPVSVVCVHATVKRL